MSKRAEERALEFVPVGQIENNLIYTRKEVRKFVEKTYEQAEKDLALTADEIRLIFNEVRFKQSIYNTTEGCYQEVADWFNEQRKK